MIMPDSYFPSVHWNVQKKQACPAIFAPLEFVLTADADGMIGKKKKPAPDQYLLAAEMLGVHPSACLVFEDTPQGATAALAAGMNVVAVESDYVSTSSFPEGVQIAPSLKDFKAKLWPGLGHVR